LGFQHRTIATTLTEQVAGISAALRGKPQSQHPHGLWGPEPEQARSWPTWGNEISSFHWTYDEQETCLLLEGDVSVTPNI
jgi:uncharacterized cupin superfamily protein